MNKYFDTLDMTLYNYAHKPPRSIRAAMRKQLDIQHDVVGGWRYIVDLWKKDREEGYKWGGNTPKPVVHPDVFKRIRCLLITK